MPRPLSMASEDLKQYIKKNAGKETPYQMSVYTGVSAGTIIRYAYKLGISLELSDRKHQREILGKYILQYHELKTASEIADMLGVPRATVYYRGWKMGVTFKKELQPVSAELVVSTQQRFFNVKSRSNWLV